MEAVATFLILLSVYFLGSLAIVQLVIHPFRKVELDPEGRKKTVKTNHFKILLVSIMLSLVSTLIALMVFP
jgi:hypothetical protein